MIGLTEEQCPKNPAKWANLITKKAREHPRSFYLPMDEKVGFSERMSVDFRTVFPVNRTELEKRKHLRIGRLGSVAIEHFRESLAHFFRRYAYNEWYPLNKEELDGYAKNMNEPIERYEWQK